MDSLDTCWCPVCDRMILPKRYTVPVAPPQPATSASPSASTESATQKPLSSRTRGGLVQGTGRAKLGASRRTATKQCDAVAQPAAVTTAPAKAVKTKSVIDQSPLPLYCSDACQLADLNRVGSWEESRTCPLPMAARANSTSSATSASSSESDDSSASSSFTQTSARSYQEMSPSVAKLAEIYDFPALPPPPPLLPAAVAATKAPIARGAEAYQHGIMEAGKKLRAVLRPPPPPKRTAFQSPAERYTAQLQAKQRAPVVAGWTDGSDAWRASVYSMSSSTSTTSPTYVAFPHRSSGGVVSSLTRTEAPQPTLSASPDALPALYGNYPLFDQRREDSRARMYPAAAPASLPTTAGEVGARSKRDVPLVPRAAAGKLLVPAGITLKRNSSAATVCGVVSPPPHSPRLLSRRGSGMSEMVVPDHRRTVVLPTPQPRIKSADDLTYTVPLPMQRERRLEKCVVDGVEVEIEVEVLVPKERAPRLFLGPSGFDEGRVARRRERELAARRAADAEKAKATAAA